jgi:hypothetical protein
MVGRNNYRVKRSPLAGKRKKFLLYTVVTVSVMIIVFGLYSALSFHPKITKSANTTVTTGDQPLKQQMVVYVTADGGLSLRSDHSASSDRLLLIPDGTKLTVIEELDGWYQVTYSGSTGWISEQYTTTSAPATDPTTGWTSFTFKSGAKIKYEPGWQVQDYSNTTDAGDTVAFSNQQLPTSLPTGSDFIAPIIVNFTAKTPAAAEKTYTSIGGVVAENLTVAGQAAKKYTYTSTTSNTQVTSVVVPNGNKAIVFNEAGGYADDLLKMLNTFTIN